jgi:hypothetical protein
VTRAVREGQGDRQRSDFVTRTGVRARPTEVDGGDRELGSPSMIRGRIPASLGDETGGLRTASTGVEPAADQPSGAPPALSGVLGVLSPVDLGDLAVDARDERRPLRVGQGERGARAPVSAAPRAGLRARSGRRVGAGLLLHVRAEPNSHAARRRVRFAAGLHERPATSTERERMRGEAGCGFRPLLI